MKDVLYKNIEYGTWRIGVRLEEKSSSTRAEKEKMFLNFQTFEGILTTGKMIDFRITVKIIYPILYNFSVLFFFYSQKFTILLNYLLSSFFEGLHMSSEVPA